MQFLLRMHDTINEKSKMGDLLTKENYWPLLIIDVIISCNYLTVSDS